MTEILRNREIQNLSIEDLYVRLASYKKSLFNARFNSVFSDKKDTSHFRKYKKSIARIKTRINQFR